MNKKIKVPRVIDLNCNGKAHILDVNGDRFLISYETPVAVVRKNGDCYRLYDINTNTTWRHWGAFVDYIGLASIRKGADSFRALPEATAA